MSAIDLSERNPSGDRGPHTSALAAALAYHCRGWSIVPVKPGTKRPACEWERHQDERASEDQLHLWFDPDRGGRYTDFAVVLGDVSGRLAVRDFDVGKAYDDWADAYPEYARVLPTVKTARGCHVYVIRPADSRIRGITKLSDGEFRADGAVVVAPPSRHPSGSQYAWIIPLPDGKIPEIDPAEIGLVPAKHVQVPPTVPLPDTIPTGQRNSTLTSLAGTMRRRGASAHGILAALREENASRCDPPLTDSDVSAIARSVSRYKPVSSGAGGHSLNNESSREPVLVKLADVEPEEVVWLWWPFIPLGKLTILEGDPGVGKTSLALQLAAIVSQGYPFPNHDGVPRQPNQPASVVYLSAEDGLADTLRPRLDACGADVTRIHALTGIRVRGDDGSESEQAVTLQDIPVIEQALVSIRPALLVVDPLQAYLGAKVDMHRANETRPVLAALAGLGERYKCAALCIRHLGKSHQDRPVYRGLGSIDLAAAARSILLAAEDPRDPRRRVMAHVKSSLATRGKSIGFELGDGFFRWTAVVDIGADELLAPRLSTDECGAVDEAVDFLQEALSDGPRPINELRRQAKRLKISEASLRRAKKQTEVITRRRPTGGGWGQGEWEWSLPEPGDPDPQDTILQSPVDHLKIPLQPNDVQVVSPLIQDDQLITLSAQRATQGDQVSTLSEQPLAHPPQTVTVASQDDQPVTVNHQDASHGNRPDLAEDWETGTL